MSTATTELLAAIRALPVAEQLALAHAIYEDTAEAGDAPMSAAMEAELDRRIAAYRANPSAVTPWEEVRAQVAARYKS